MSAASHQIRSMHYSSPSMSLTSADFQTPSTKRKFGSDVSVLPFSSTKLPVKTTRVLKRSLKNLGQFLEDETNYGTSIAAILLKNGDISVLRNSIRDNSSMLTQYGGAVHSYMPRCVYTVVPGDSDKRTANVMLDLYVDTLKKEQTQ